MLVCVEVVDVGSGNEALAARLRARERAHAEQRALTQAYAAEDELRRAEARRSELAAQGERIVAAARAKHAQALRGVVSAAGSEKVAAALLAIGVRELRDRCASDGQPATTRRRCDVRRNVLPATAEVRPT